jgi:hypothetical protein
MSSLPLGPSGECNGHLLWTALTGSVDQLAAIVTVSAAGCAALQKCVVFTVFDRGRGSL